MTETRWTEETEALAEAAAQPWTVAFEGNYRAAARRVLYALADAGLLVEPGSETETVWAVIGEDADGPYVEFTLDEADARRSVRTTYAADPSARAVRRTVHTSPWQDAS